MTLEVDKLNRRDTEVRDLVDSMTPQEPPGDKEEARMMARERVSVVLDGSPTGEQALPYALSRADARGAELHLLQIVHPSISLPGRTVNRDAERAAWLYLLSVAERLGEAHAPVTYQVRRGWTLPILRCEAKQAATVFLATRSATLVQRVLGSAVVAALVGLWSRAVVVVRPSPPSSARKEAVRSFTEDARHYPSLFQRPLGIHAVALERVVGSVGRAHELHCDFRPRSADEHNLRYRELRRAMEQGVEVPPIELYKLGDWYYVLDGNHRVSVALALSWSQIDAMITEFVPMNDADAQAVARERQAFEHTFGLETVEAARPGHYPRLASFICDYRIRQGIEDERRAAQAWYMDVYLPLERRLRSAKLCALFWGEKSGDLVIHLASIRELQEAFLGRPISWDEALTFMLHRYGRASRNPWRAFKIQR